MCCHPMTTADDTMVPRCHDRCRICLRQCCWLHSRGIVTKRDGISGITGGHSRRWRWGSALTIVGLLATCATVVVLQGLVPVSYVDSRRGSFPRWERLYREAGLLVASDPSPDAYEVDEGVRQALFYERCTGPRCRSGDTGGLPLERFTHRSGAGGTSEVVSICLGFCSRKKGCGAAAPFRGADAINCG